MTRSRSTSRLGLAALLLLLALGSEPAARAQPRADPAREAPVATAPVPDSAAAAVAAGPAPEPSSSNWPLLLGVLGGIALGVLGARLWSRSSRPLADGASAPVARAPVSAALPVPQRRAENVPKAPPAAAPNAPNAPTESPVKPASAQSLSKLQDRPPAAAPSSKPASKPSGGKGKSPRSSQNPNPSKPAPDRAVPHRSSAMHPTQPPVPSSDADSQSLETGQTVEWSAPTSTPPALQELIDATAPEGQAATSAQAAAPAPAASGGPVQYYAPAPDVPSIEHRKLSPNPLPQMPLLITLASAEATVARFSFSPQADQSRIIGNGVRELKEFFAFELPPTERFTTIKNLADGKLERRDDAWHVVQKAGIALS